MPTIIPETFAEISVLFLRGFDGNTLTNVFGVKLDLPLDQAAVDDISDALGTAYKGFMPDSWFFNGIHVLEGQAGDPLAWDSVEGAAVGTYGNFSEAPPQVMYLVAKSSSLSGRKHRGRTFIAPVDEDETANDGTLQVVERARVQAGADDIFAACAGVHLDGMYILHTDATAPTEVTSYVVSDKVASLRRRYRR